MLLDLPHVSPVLEQMDGDGVPQQVRVQVAHAGSSLPVQILEEPRDAALLQLLFP